RYVSDGTIKMFAYLVLLHDPSPHPLLCVEEPENQLYPQLMRELAEEFRSYANRGGQVFVSTHSPDFLNAIELEEVAWLVKQDGCTEIRWARDNRAGAHLLERRPVLRRVGRVRERRARVDRDRRQVRRDDVVQVAGHGRPLGPDRLVPVELGDALQVVRALPLELGGAGRRLGLARREVRTLVRELGELALRPDVRGPPHRHEQHRPELQRDVHELAHVASGLARG